MMGQTSTTLPLWEGESTDQPSQAPSPLSTQVGGEHYKQMAIQPLEFAMANKLDFFQLNVIKYVTRHKGGLDKRLEDLRKAKHYLEIYLEAIQDGRWK